MTRRFLRSLSLSCCSLLLLASFSATTREAAAVVIVAESFDRTDGFGMAGATPNIANLPGGVFTAQTNRGGYLVSNNTLEFGPDNSLSLPLGSYYTGDLSLSADLSRGNLGNSADFNRGVALGFNASPTGSWNVTFTGLRLTNSSTLAFQSGNSVKASVSVTTSSNTFYSLSYDVNVDTGVISTISLGGSGNSAVDFSPIYTASQSTNYFAGSPNLSVFAGGSKGGQFGYVDNLSLSNTTAVPEPSTVVMLAIAGGIATAAARRRRK